MQNFENQASKIFFDMSSPDVYLREPRTSRKFSSMDELFVNPVLIRWKLSVIAFIKQHI